MIPGQLQLCSESLSKTEKEKTTNIDELTSIQRISKGRLKWWLSVYVVSCDLILSFVLDFEQQKNSLKLHPRYSEADSGVGTSAGERKHENPQGKEGGGINHMKNV